VREAFVRPIANRRALGSYAALAGTPFSSGGSEREQGIGKDGSVTLPNRARNKSPGTSDSRRSDDFTPCLHGRCPEGSVRSC